MIQEIKSKVGGEQYDFADLMIHLSKRLVEADGIEVDWRVLKKYCDDFLDDNCLKLEIKNE